MTHGSPRAWNERDHPRDNDGRFRDKVGSGGWAQRISDSIGKGRGESGSDEDNPQLVWESKVRDLFRAAGHDPDQVEADVEGFGQDYAEYADDPEGFVQTILEDMEPLDAGGGGTGFDGLPDGDEPGEKVISAHDLAAQDGWDGFEVFNPESGKWEVLRNDSEAVGAGRSGVEGSTGFISTEGDGFYFTAEPDPEDYDDDEEYEQALADYEDDPHGELRIRRQGTPEPSPALPKIPKMTPQLERDAAWVETFEVGQEWHAGAFRPNRENELIALGVLIPTDKPGVFTVGRRRTI